MKQKNYLGKVLEVFTFLCFGLLVINVTAQVVTRNLMPSVNLTWTEEASRFLFVYTVTFAAPLAMKNKEYINVDIILGMLPKNLQTIAQFLLDIIAIVLFSVIAYQGFFFAQRGIGQTSPALSLPMWIMYATIPIMSVLIAFYGIYNLVIDLIEVKKEKKEEVNC